MGASKLQLTATSYNEARPKLTGHDEASWRENRRDDLVPETSPLG